VSNVIEIEECPAPNISGILDRDIQTATQATLGGGPLDAVHKAITQIRLVEEEPSGIVVNPSDWEIFRLAKDLNEQYYGGGPFTAAYGNSGGLGSLPVVVTAAIAAGTLLVGAFKTGAQIFRRSGISIEATNSHGDNFQYDVTVLRAESRLALAVYKPDAFFAITGVEAESA
jgi:HK97 family phage major capsid protein